MQLITIPEGAIVKKLYFVLFFCLFQTISFSQVQQSFLQKQLPQAIQTNPEILKQVTQVLKRDISLHPDLIAYRMNFYDRLFNQGIKDNNENGLNNLNLITAHFNKMRNLWIRKQQQNISASNSNINYKNLSNDFLEDYFSEIPDSLGKPELFLNKNLVDYYALFSLGEQTIEKYNPQINYSAERTKIQNGAREDYKKKLNVISKVGFTDLSIEKIIDNWFLFDENSPDQKIITDYILNYFSSLYSTDKLNLNAVFLGGAYYVLKDGIDIKFNQPINSTETIIGSLSKIAQVDFHVSHMFPLKDELSIFSFLNIGLSGSFLLSQNEEGIEPKMVYIRNTRDSQEYISETWTFSKLSLTDIQVFSADLQASLPVVFFNHYMFLEVGVKSGFDFYSYILSSKYSYGKVEVKWDPNQQQYVRNILYSKPSETTSEKKLISKFRLYPTVGLTIQKFNPILIQFSASYNYISARLGYSF